MNVRPTLSCVAAGAGVASLAWVLSFAELSPRAQLVAVTGLVLLVVDLLADVLAFVRGRRSR